MYLGTGDGQFGVARSFFAGTNPAGITVQDLNDDGLPDLVVANEGSNDVTLLLGHGQGSSWTLAPGARLQSGGQGPVSTVVQDVPVAGSKPDGIPDLVVANSRSNTVAVIPGVGQGFFDDRNPDIKLAGLDPRQVLVGNFDGNPGLDLLTINAGSSDLTFFSNFGAGRSIGSGGDRPVSAADADFNGDGLADLVVANNGNGVISLLLGGADGPSLGQLFGLGDFIHPTAVAVDAQLHVYVADEGRESATLLTSFAIPVPAPTGPQGSPVAELFFLNGPGFTKGLDIVIAGEDRGAVGEPGGTSVALATDAPKGAVVVLVAGANEEQAAEPDVAAHPGPNLDRFMIGLEDPFETGVPDTSADGADAAPVALDQFFTDWRPTDVETLWNHHWLLARAGDVGLLGVAPAANSTDALGEGTRPLPACTVANEMSATEASRPELLRLKTAPEASQMLSNLLAAALVACGFSSAFPSNRPTAEETRRKS